MPVSSTDLPRLPVQPVDPAQPLGPLDDGAIALHEDDPVLHVANRLAHGPTPELVRDIQTRTPAGWIESQLHPELIDDTSAEAAVAGFAMLRMSPATLREAKANTGDLRREVRVSALLRAVHSRRQLQEVMVEFWRNHFSVDIGAYWEGLTSGHYEYEVIRPHALGRFRDLLHAVATSPTMLAYLDNDASRAPDVNENYARELLELHTVGVDGGYGEQDVRNAAFVLSGWGFDRQSVAFTFREQFHDGRAARVMDWSAPAGTGVERGRSLLDHLAVHPATAFFLASKLARWFIGPDASTGVVNRAAKAYLTADTDVTALLRVLLFSEEFLATPGTKVRQPFSQLAAWLRSLDATTDTTAGSRSAGTRQLDHELAVLGQRPWAWPTPDGNPDEVAHWSGSALLLARWRLASRLASGRVPGVDVDLGGLAGGAATVGELVDQLGARLHSRLLTPAQREPLVAFGGGEGRWVGDLERERLRELYALALVLPATQRR